MRSRFLLFAIAIGALGACASARSTKTEMPRPPLSGEKIATQIPSVSNGKDECRASRFRYLVGKSRSEIPAKPSDAVWRIACTSCAITMDLSPKRLNIFFDEKTNVIKEVKCG
jgi:hypothetical protein